MGFVILFFKLLTNSFWKLTWLAYFTALPLMITVGLVLFFYTTKPPFLIESAWLMPGILGASAVISGIFIGEKSAKEGGMGAFAFGILSQLIFAFLAWVDLQFLETYATYLPPVESDMVIPLVFSLPTLGMIGMIFLRNWCF